MFKLLSLLVLLSAFFIPQTFADPSEETANGNLIREPELADYVAATRAPGILSAPFDIVEEE